jgi:CBS domain-containing protein
MGVKPLDKMTSVKDVMRRDIVSISVNETVSDAANYMKEKGVSALIVLRGRNPMGIITEKDIVRRVVCEKKDPDKALVGSVMSTPLIAITPLASLEDAADAFRRGKVKKLAVVSGGVLEGIISVTDILAAETRDMKAVSRYVELLSK